MSNVILPEEVWPEPYIAKCNFPGCDQDATFIEAVKGDVKVWCEPHGEARGLTRGIPSDIKVRDWSGSNVHHNIAEPESRCAKCGAPLESGHICVGCAQQ